MTAISNPNQKNRLNMTNSSLYELEVETRSIHLG